LVGLLGLLYKAEGGLSDYNHCGYKIAIEMVILKELFDTHSELFPVSITEKERLRKRVQVYRTLRTSDTRAINKKVSKSDIDVVNRWKSLKQADGNRPHHAMPALRKTGTVVWSVLALHLGNVIGT
jgi:hypothetical protein